MQHMMHLWMILNDGINQITHINWYGFIMYGMVITRPPKKRSLSITPVYELSIREFSRHACHLNSSTKTMTSSGGSII